MYTFFAQQSFDWNARRARLTALERVKLMEAGLQLLLH
jgi:hypothetical protein